MRHRAHAGAHPEAQAERVILTLNVTFRSNTQILPQFHFASKKFSCLPLEMDMDKYNSWPQVCEWGGTWGEQWSRALWEK